MARRGRFGQAPRVAPNLTNTIISIAREMQNRRDQNLMDAWEKGGMFEGQKATDELVLAHWRQRLDGVSRDDPLYDTYKNAVSQYEYAISESKASTEYAQGRRSDAGMAKFYLDWAKRVPKNSEFYRVLQRDAAQFMRAAKAKASAAAAKAKEEAYQKAQEADYQKYEKPAEYMTDVMRNLARSNALIGADFGSDLTQFDPSDPTAMLRLLNTITQTPRGGPSREEVGTGLVLYHDPITGKPVTGGDIVAQLHKLDPHFDGRVNLDYFRGLLTRAIQGQSIRLDRATQTGHATDVSAIQKSQQYTAEIGREAAIWPVQQGYNTARQTFLSTWQSASATPDMKVQAFRQYAASLTKLANDPATDDNTRARLLAEVNGDGSVNSLAEDFTGLNSSDHQTTTGTTGGTKGDIAETSFDLQRYLAMQQEVASNAAYWTTGETDDQGVFHAKPGGVEIGAATFDDIQQASPVQPTVIFVPQGGGSKPIPVIVTGANIKAFALDDKGEQVTLTDANPVGAYYDVTVNGVRTRVYSYKGNDGHTYYTTSTPWDDANVGARETPQGLQLNLSAYVPHQNEQGDWVNAAGQPVNLDGSGPFGLSAPNTKGDQKLVMDPSGMTYASDPARAAAGPDPVTDFFSPTLAALTSSPEGLKVLSTLRSDPQFQQQLALEAQAAATNMSTGEVDQTLLNQYNAQINLATHLPEVGDMTTGFLSTATSMWDRFTTAPTFQTKEGSQPPTSQQAEHYAEVNGTPLPSDAVRGTQFGALADVFHFGTNLIRQATGAEGGLKLQVNGTIKVPEPPTGNVTPKTFAPPSTTPPPVTPVNTFVPPTSTVSTTKPPADEYRPLVRPGSRPKAY